MAHRTKATRELATSHSFESRAHVSYSPEMAPTDDYSFALIGHALLEQRFSSSENAKKLVHGWLKENLETFLAQNPQVAIKKRKQIASDGYYFEELIGYPIF